MNQDTDYSSEADREVSATYRAVASESAPPRLDRRVLLQAATAARSKWFQKYSFPLLRPLTFVVTLGLSLAIVLQFSDTLIIGTPDSAGPVITETDQAAAEASAGHIEEQTQPGASVLSRESLNRTPPLIAGADVQRTEAVRYCEAAQAESADKWWDCIVQLERDGQIDAFSSERELFIRIYPDIEKREKGVRVN